MTGPVGRPRIDAAALGRVISEGVASMQASIREAFDAIAAGIREERQWRDDWADWLGGYRGGRR